MDRPGRRWPSRRLVALGAAFAIASWGALAFAGASRADPSPKPPDRQALARRLLQSPATGYMTGPAQSLLRMIASGGRNLTFGQPKLPEAPIASGGLAPTAPVFTNVRVNDPSLDMHQVDQTTQSETSIAVAGSHVAVGYNDSQQTPLFPEAGTTLAGYSYSSDGGATWTDGGALPNAPEFANFGDPWLTSDRSGNMFYANLAFDAFNFNGDVAVAKSTDGGKTWGEPVPTLRPPFSTFYFADKDAMTAGRDPSIASRDDIYVAWDDFSFDALTGKAFTGLPVARSTDGGATWQVTYAGKIPLFSQVGCGFAQFIGAQPLVDPSDGTLWVAAEKIVVDDPHCTGGKVRFIERIFRSTDGGKSFSGGVNIANVTPATPDGLLGLAPGQYMRTIEFPVLALANGKLYAAWNDGGLDGHSHIRLATSANGGAAWSLSWATTGSNDEVQPSLSGDASGLHLLYYRRNPNGTLDVYLGTSTGGAFDAQRVTTQSSPGVFTIPPFDPIIAFGYMGDYITNVSDGGHLYFSWGDNRDIVTNFMWPNGRNDPDVFFAKQ